MTDDLLDLQVRLRDERTPHALATVIGTEGSASAKVGAKAIIDAEGRLIAGWVGGGCAESSTCRAALESMSSGEPQVLEIDLTDELLGAGMPCGGTMRIYVEPALPRPVLWILGHGRVAECLCVMGDMLGLDVVIDDPGARREDYPAARRLLTDDLDYSALKPRAEDFVVVATQHKGDHQSIARALETDVGYIALIASRKRATIVFDQLRELGVAEGSLRRVRSPAGLNLGGKSPEEIALSLMAEIVAVRRGADAAPLAEPAGRA